MTPAGRSGAPEVASQVGEVTSVPAFELRERDQERKYLSLTRPFQFTLIRGALHFRCHPVRIGIVRRLIQAAIGHNKKEVGSETEAQDLLRPSQLWQPTSLSRTGEQAVGRSRPAPRTLTHYSVDDKLNENHTEKPSQPPRGQRALKCTFAWGGGMHRATHGIRHRCP